MALQARDIKPVKALEMGQLSLEDHQKGAEHGHKTKPLTLRITCFLHLQGIEIKSKQSVLGV